MPGTQIIGYAEPWIVSPGEPVDVKVCCFFVNDFPMLTATDLKH